MGATITGDPDIVGAEVTPHAPEAQPVEVDVPQVEQPLVTAGAEQVLQPVSTTPQELPQVVGAGAQPVPHVEVPQLVVVPQEVPQVVGGAAQVDPQLVEPQEEVPHVGGGSQLEPQVLVTHGVGAGAHEDPQLVGAGEHELHGVGAGVEQELHGAGAGVEHELQEDCAIGAGAEYTTGE